VAALEVEKPRLREADVAFKLCLVVDSRRCPHMGDGSNRRVAIDATRFVCVENGFEELVEGRWICLDRVNAIAKRVL
jgi:hypothetical protein